MNSVTESMPVKPEKAFALPFEIKVVPAVVNEVSLPVMVMLSIVKLLPKLPVRVEPSSNVQFLISPSAKLVSAPSVFTSATVARKHYDILSETFEETKKPGKLRLIEFMDDEGKTYQFLTNNFRLAASSIAEIYRQRWQIELFFKWIKQNLKNKSFLGSTKNAVMTQIWVALILYLLLSYIKFINKCRYSITELANRLRDTLMSDFALLEVLNLNRDTLKKPPDWNAPEQLDLFANSCYIF